MSVFAKVLIVVNGVFSFALCGLLAVLLAHKYDYKNLHRTMHRQAEVVKSALGRVRMDIASSEQAFGQKNDRQTRKRTETEIANKDLDEVVKGLTDQLSASEREASRLEGDVKSLEDRVKDLTERRNSLRTEITTLEKDREDAIAEGKGFDQKREEKYKANFKLLTELRDQEQQLNKLSDRLLLLEYLWLYIVKNYPRLGLDIAIPDLKATVTAVSDEIVMVSCGKDDGVRVGSKLVLQRGNTFVGVIEVRNVDKERSWGVLVERGPGAPVQIGDVATPDKKK